MARSTAYDRFPEHTVEISAETYAVKVIWQGHLVADTQAARVLHEARYPAAYYLPIADADPALLSKTDHSTHCPFKGDASYYSLVADGVRDENAVWVYEDPFDQVEAIREHVSFYPDRVTIEADR